MKVSLGGLVITLSLSAVSLGSEPTCRELFSNPRATTGLSLEVASLNQASQEYLARLNNLIFERNLLEPTVLDRILASPRPLNPISRSAVSVVLYPHHEAFAALMKENLQWNEIRQAAASLASLARHETKRTEVAVEKTKRVLLPKILASFSFQAQAAVRLADSRALAIVASQDAAKPTTTLTAHDLSANGAKSYTVTFNGKADLEMMKVKAIGETALAVIPVKSENRVVIIDLLAQKVVGDTPCENPLPENAGFSLKQMPIDKVDFIEDAGETRVAVLQGNRLHLLSAKDAKELKALNLFEQTSQRSTRAGVIGSFIFGAASTDTCYANEISSQQNGTWVRGFSAFDGFAFRGENYLLGLEQENQSTSRHERLLKTLATRAGQRSPAFPVQATLNDPCLLDTFEEKDTLNGVIATNLDVYVVDLINGRILETLSQTPSQLTKGVHARWSRDHVGQVDFQFDGKPYLLAKYFEKQPFVPDGLIILDARTLLPQGQMIKLDQEFQSLRKIPSDGKDLLFLINLRDGTSRLLSLANDLT